MMLRNKEKDMMWIKGIELKGGETKEVPGITLPEIMSTILRSKVEVIHTNKASPKRSPKKAKEKEKEKPKVTVEPIKEEPMVVAELKPDGTVEHYDTPKTVEEVTKPKEENDTTGLVV